MLDQPAGASAEADLAALREVLDTTVNRRLTETITKLSNAALHVGCNRSSTRYGNPSAAVCRSVRPGGASPAKAA